MTAGRPCRELRILCPNIIEGRAVLGELRHSPASKRLLIDANTFGALRGLRGDGLLIVILPGGAHADLGFDLELLVNDGAQILEIPYGLHSEVASWLIEGVAKGKVPIDIADAMLVGFSRFRESIRVGL